MALKDSPQRHRDTEITEKEKSAAGSHFSIRNIFGQGQDCLRRFWFSVISVSLCLCGESYKLRNGTGL